ncbi:hypothetical protein D9619_012331 [Psilocybe cf. subviscida]|uniref:Uncharacterized protein n=1 Tax=Psilocybe cf. subviscida TaxID=2480587 RepID=A0A8H5ERG6_9AGAR|nr:hypothetical protein D9619_012331 [Psilocybe cf. subviscida]
MHKKREAGKQWRLQNSCKIKKTKRAADNTTAPSTEDDALLKLPRRLSRLRPTPLRCPPPSLDEWPSPSPSLPIPSVRKRNLKATIYSSTAVTQMACRGSRIPRQ